MLRTTFFRRKAEETAEDDTKSGDPSGTRSGNSVTGDNCIRNKKCFGRRKGTARRSILTLFASNPILSLFFAVFLSLASRLVLIVDLSLELENVFDMVLELGAVPHEKMTMNKLNATLVSTATKDYLRNWDHDKTNKTNDDIMEQAKQNDSSSDINQIEPNDNTNPSLGVQFIKDLIEIKTTSSLYKNGTKETRFDVLSIGSISQIDLLHAQSNTWASNPSVRNFYGATESDDPDPTCYQKLTTDEVYKRCKHCRTKKNYKVKSNIVKIFTNQYATPKWLAKKANPVGWMCAQRRPAFALSKLLRFYREAIKIHGDDVLPSYLLLTDDDTYVDLEMLKKKLIMDVGIADASDPSLMLIPSYDTPVVFAGCRVRMPIQDGHFTFPFGGFGQFFSKGALRRMVQPLYCNKIPLAGFEEEACERINDSNAATIGETSMYKPGMSISDLMEVYVASNQFCAHSDWLTGYFVNFYNISRHVVDDGVWFNEKSRMDNVKEARFHTFDKSEIYKRVSGHCTAEYLSSCTKQSMICHRLSANDMLQRHGGGRGGGRRGGGEGGGGGGAGG